MKVTQDILQKYATLIVHTGVHVQPGQKVVLNANVEQHAFATLIAEECYKAGAARVTIEWSCDKKSNLDYTYASKETLGTVLPWEEAKYKQLTEDLPVMIHLLSEDPDALAGIEPQKISSVMQMRSKVLKPYRNQMDGKYQWLGCAVPSPAWAKKCFPELSEEDAVQKLWDAILYTVRVNETDDPNELWAEHINIMNQKADWLNNQHFEKLVYKSANGTDFNVTLIPDALFNCAGMTNPLNNVYFTPNMPTEEVFTSPLAGKCEGTLVSTKPLSWNGQLIENFSVTFENGKAVKVQAEKGQELLEQMIHMDETACMLGEVALVPKESPVNQCGFLFYNTLFDENACCHVALGMGFKDVLPDGDDLTREQAKERGINDSCIHVDFMVGSDDLSIIGIRPDGTTAQIFENGTWAI